MDRKSRICKLESDNIRFKTAPGKSLKFCHDASFDSLPHMSLAMVKAQVPHTRKTIVARLSEETAFRSDEESHVKFYTEFNRFDLDLFVYKYHMFLSSY